MAIVTFNSTTINNVLIHKNQLSASDLAKLNANPNLMGKLALETKGTTKTIPELDMVMDAGASADSYYMCSEESSAYLVDSRVSYGTEEVKIGLLATDFNGLNSTDAIVGEWLEVTTTAIDPLSMFTYLTTQTTPNITNMPDDLNDIVVMEFTAYCDVGITGTIETVRTSPAIDVPLETSPTTYTFIFKYIDNPYFKFATTVGTGKLYLKVSDGSLSIRKATAIEIANYTETVRTNADLQQKGIQTTAFVTDGAGTPLSYTSNILNFDANSYTDTQWNPSLESTFWLEEIIDGIVYQHKYDGANLTTYTDNVAGTPVAHSPENASYLLGKGVYPKVTADPYTSYQAKTFQLHTGTRYTNYDQTARYAILSAL